MMHSLFSILGLVAFLGGVIMLMAGGFFIIAGTAGVFFTAAPVPDALFISGIESFIGGFFIIGFGAGIITATDTGSN